jgi:hypothetical protein
MSSRGKTRKGKDDWIVAIPSYKRAETVRDKTLSVLKKYRIPASKIYVFVADDSEKEIYEKTLEKGTYNQLIVGVPGLAEQRNFISDYFPVGKKIVEADDDIKGFLEYDKDAKRSERPLRSLINIIRRGFSECDKVGATLWGIYPVANGFFMKDTVSTDLKNIIGSFWGWINPGTKGEKGIKLTMSEKEDYLRAILCWERDGVLVRLNFVSPKTSYYTEPGGMQTDPKRREKHEKAIEYLLEKYPEYVARLPGRKSGYPEIILKRVKQEKEKGKDKSVKKTRKTKVHI